MATQNDVAARLAEMLGQTPAEASEAEGTAGSNLAEIVSGERQAGPGELPGPALQPASQQTGRSGSGRLRNFRAMQPAKLIPTYFAVRDENNDPEAFEALHAEMEYRGLLS